MWSKRNVEKVGKLTEEGKMMPSGLEEVERAKRDGRWERAYSGQKAMEVPKDFKEALAGNKAAKEAFDAMNKSKRYGILLKLETAKKTEARASRVEMLVETLAKGGNSMK
jgi:uncharacterized protein YdeI (YjbR/CyaY-like superfamily)